MLPCSIGDVVIGIGGQVFPGPARKPVLASSGSFAPSPLSSARSMIVLKPGVTTATFASSIASLVHTLLPMAVRQATEPLSTVGSGNPAKPPVKILMYQL